VRVGDGHWNGITHIFILHWQEQVWLYESLGDSAAHFNPETKDAYASEYSPPLQELRQVKNQADQLQAFHGKNMHYDSYCIILLSAASSYDAQFAPKRRADCTTAKAPRRNVYAHDFADFGDDEINDTYNLDSDIVDLL